MKKIIIGLSLCVASSVAFAVDGLSSTAICAAGAGTAIDASTTAFVKSAFTPKCSANTSVGFIQTSNLAAVGAVSLKGNQVFGGHTNGGAVAKLTTGGDCASTGCTATNATGAATTSLAAGSS